MPNDTIVALSTPPGRSGIGVVRLSGAAALAITRKLVCEPDFTPPPRRAILKKIFDSDSGEVLDQAVLTFFQAPNSFTGEDVIEISCHGSPILLRQVVDSSLLFDARLAEAGEFTLRALSNGRINLSQAEAVRDLIDAKTASAVRQAARQLGGELSAQIQPLKDDLLNVIVVLESALEFIEDDLPAVAAENVKLRLLGIDATLGQLADTFRAGRLLREGLRVALVGKPNVGKSSLFNVLLGQDRAIVTDVPGTTRDSLHESLSIHGVPVALIDTAGVRDSTDRVESIGVERTRRAIADADLIAVVLDNSEPLDSEDREVLNATENTNRVIALNKTDLPCQFSINSFDGETVVKVSAKSGEGLSELREAIVAPFGFEDAETSGFLISDARHHDLLRRAQSEIENSLQLFQAGTSEEIVLVGLHNALHLLGEITGETTPEDVLTRIFSTFCIGK
jgi:tRNA modification GTPase